MMVSCPASPLWSRTVNSPCLWSGRKLPSQRLFLHFLAKRGGHPNPVDRGSDDKDKMLPPKAPKARKTVSDFKKLSEFIC